MYYAVVEELLTTIAHAAAVAMGILIAHLFITQCIPAQNVGYCAINNDNYVATS